MWMKDSPGLLFLPPEDTTVLFQVAVDIRAKFYVASKVVLGPI